MARVYVGDAGRFNEKAREWVGQLRDRCDEGRPARAGSPDQGHPQAEALHLTASLTYLGADQVGMTVAVLDGGVAVEVARSGETDQSPSDVCD